MRKFGLIGYPLGHSFSKKYFDDKFDREGIPDCSYENFPMNTLENLPGLISDNEDLCGLNVTIPFKTEILRFVDATEPDIEEIGALNVLKIKRLNGKIRISGYNSDVVGIRDSIMPFMTGKVKNALVLGTGGSSRAVIYTLKKLGINVTLISRNRRPGILAYSDLTSRKFTDTDIIINTTPLGMYPDILTRPELDYNMLNKNHILFDLVYNPEITSFLKMGKEKGCKIITGLKMLYSQAERSWEIWNDDKL
jgi:shikimate dehydrogenase